MSDSFLSKFSKLPATTQPVSSTAQFSNTLPASQCPNGNPIDNYSGYGVNSYEVLYSVWNSYQSTIGAQFTQSQSNNFAPTPAQDTMVGPKNIFIIRHGEKIPSTPTNRQFHLNQNGVYRACQIPTVVNKLAEIGYPISYMVSSNPCTMNTADPSMRNQQTVLMASFLLNIPMFVYGSIDETQAVADALFSTDPASPNPFNGLNVLICWEHTTTQDLCLKLMDTCSNLGVNRSSKDGNDFFADPLVSKQTCVDGKYLAPPDASAYPFNIQAVNPNPPPQYTYTSHDPITAVYPYWNTNNFDNMFCFFSNSNNTEFEFLFTNQQYFNCLTCYPSCQARIGLFQPMSTCSKTIYYTPGSTPSLEQDCLPPTSWKYPPL
jgi:hypothetical protein